MRKTIAVVSVALVLSAFAPPAFAERLDRWDVARDPGAEKVEQALLAAEMSLDRALAARDPRTRRDLARTAIAVLDDASSSSSHDARVAFTLGHAYHLLDNDPKVVEILAPAVAAAPNDPGTSGALFDLAVAYARLGRTKDEIGCYDALLEREYDPAQRHTILSNRGESKEKLGDMKGSIADYRASIELYPDEPLARWGLALTLDHAGDLAGAIEEAKLADDVDRGPISRLDSPNVFFVPDYRRYWYYALREVAKAAKAPRAIDKQMHWDAAAANMATYVAHATSDDEWVPLARARIKTFEAQSARLRADVARERKNDASRLHPRRFD